MVTKLIKLICTAAVLVAIMAIVGFAETLNFGMVLLFCACVLVINGCCGAYFRATKKEANK